MFNEVNTIPGLTCKSRYARMLEAAGISFKTFINILLDGWYKMKDIVMDQRSVYKGNLILVNRDNPIRERLAESDLVPVSQMIKAYCYAVQRSACSKSLSRR